MQATLVIDDALVAQACEMAEREMDLSTLLHEAIRTFIRVEAGRRIGELGGQAPDMAPIPRRRDALEPDGP